MCWKRFKLLLHPWNKICLSLTKKRRLTTRCRSKPTRRLHRLQATRISAAVLALSTHLLQVPCSCIRIQAPVVGSMTNYTTYLPLIERKHLLQVILQIIASRQASVGLDIYEKTWILFVAVVIGNTLFYSLLYLKPAALYSSLPETLSLPSAKLFAEYNISGTWQTSSLPSAKKYSANKQICRVQKKHSAKILPSFFVCRVFFLCFARVYFLHSAKNCFKSYFKIVN